MRFRPRLRRDLVDAAGVPSAGEARVHQHRLSGGGDDQGGRPALDVDPVDVEPLVGRAAARSGTASARTAPRDRRRDASRTSLRYPLRSAVVPFELSANGGAAAMTRDAVTPHDLRGRLRRSAAAPQAERPAAPSTSTRRSAWRATSPRAG